MAGRIVLVDDSVDPRDLTDRVWPRGSHLLFLYWASNGTLSLLRGQQDVTCHSLLDIVHSLAEWEQRAADLAIAICDSGPTHDGLPWRRLVEEPLYREALEVVAVYDAYGLVRRLVADLPKASQDGEGPELRLTPRRHILWRALDGTEETGSSVTQTAPVKVRPSLGARLMKRWRRILVTGDLRGQLWNLLDQLDSDYRWRLRWNRLRRSPKVPQRGITFFSSYLNNSHTLRQVEHAQEDAPTWVVTNRYARVGSEGTQGRVFDLYRFAQGAPIQAPLETPEPDIDAIVSHWNLQGLPPKSVRRLIDTWLRQSPTWTYWQTKGHRALANLASCWRRYLDLARPRCIVMANQWSLEGWLTEMARERGIPVLQVLHGILSGEYYTGRPIRSDRLLVAGDFWRQLWPATERSSIQVLRLADAHPKVTRKPTNESPRVTFFSWPFDRLAFYNSRELLDGFIHLFQRLLEADACRLTVRCHPLENPADILDRWKELHGDVPSSVRLSHDDSLKDVIATTDLAVMFRSTTMLDCLTNGIPFLLPGWIDFTWRPRLRGLAGIHVADDFEDLERTLSAWLEKPPTLDPRQQASFLSAELDDGSGLRRCLDELTSTHGDSD